MLGEHKAKDLFFSGIIKNNPTFVLFLGMCPTLATTTTFQGAFGMALITTLVLTMSTISVSLIRNIIPSQIRIPVYVIIIATLTKTLELLMQGYVTSLYQSLGIYLPLIVVNCIVLGRAEAFAQKNKLLPSAIDGLATGMGFTLSLSVISFLRELIGTGSIVFPNYLDPRQLLFSIRFFPQQYAISLFTTPAGAFLTLGILAGILV